MRSLLFALFSFCLLSSVHAQPWLSKLPAHKKSSELNFYDYQAAFEAYWAPFNVEKGYYMENGVKKKAAGWKHFKRWEYEMRNQIDKRTGNFPKYTAAQIAKPYFYQHQRGSTDNWRSMGPVTSDGGYAGLGRLNCITFHPADLNRYWVGAAAGGLWVTLDDGASWTCLTDQNEVLAVSDIVINPDYDASGIIYIATGDRDGWDNRSVGILKSTDFGATWNVTDLSFTVHSNNMVNRLLMNPNDPQTLIAATTQGAFITLDGGDTWSQQLTGIEFIDMEFNPANPSIIYASTKNGSIFLSENGGQSWLETYHEDQAGRIELAVTPANPTRVYALAANHSSELHEVLQSNNSGVSFAPVFDRSNANLLTWASDGNESGGQGWYDLSLAASPINPDLILLGGVNTWRSMNGGSSWSIVSHWAGHLVQEVHADKHQIKFRDNGDVFECNDGGVYKSINNGTFWEDKSNGLIISQMYKLGVSQMEREDVITGLQDNGSKLYTNGEWRDVGGGDGMECLIDYTNNDIQYYTIYYGSITRTLNHWNSASNITPSEAGDGAWVTPYIINPANPEILYAGYSEIWKTSNRGDSWEQISNLNPPGKMRAMAISQTHPDIICVADYERIWLTQNGGESWNEITYDLPTGESDINAIVISSNDPSIIWVALGQFNEYGVFQIKGNENSWTNISEGLPPIPINSLVENQQAVGEMHLYAGTDSGIYFKKGTEEWKSYNQGLPNVKVLEIEIYYDPNPELSMLRAATFGRGLWQSPVYYSAHAMEYVSCTAKQPNQSPATINSTDQEILRIEVLMTGNLEPLNLTNITLNTEGTTDAAKDLVAAKLYFTGSGSTFSTQNLFGDVVMSPDGEISFNGSQQLNPGFNNFWLAYDVSADASLGNVLDAQLVSVTIDEVRTPVDPNPDGNRPILTQYCEAGTNNNYEHINNVAMANVNQSSGWVNGGYQDFTNKVIEIETAIPQNISVNIGNVYEGDELLIWIDWNLDGDFEDEDENVYTSGRIGLSVYNHLITVPSHASVGLTRMRIRLHDTDNDPNGQPCGMAGWGDVEDYSLRIIGSDPCAYINYLAADARNIAGTYEPLGDEGTVITTSNFDDANSEPQDIGFTFRYHCGEFTQFILNTNGFIKLGNTPPSDDNHFFNGAQSMEGGIFDLDHPDDRDFIVAFNHDLDAGTGNAEYRVHTTGEAPNRVCIIQFKDVREWTTSTPQQYDNMEFQIRLYETSNRIEFIYGDWTPSTNISDYKTSSVGLFGKNDGKQQLLTVNKSSVWNWNLAEFSDQNYSNIYAFNFGNPPDRPKPDVGRTFQFNSLDAPDAGTPVTPQTICTDTKATLSVENTIGRVTWQQSADGMSNWQPVSGGQRVGNAGYITRDLNTTTYYRVEAIQTGFLPAYSDVVTVEVVSPPALAGSIEGNSTACRGESGIEYKIDPIPNATSYEWQLSGGLSGTSTTESILVAFDDPMEENTIAVRGITGTCAGEWRTKTIVRLPGPATPEIVSVVQPDCGEATGTITFSNLPSGAWTLVDVINQEFYLDGGTENYVIDDLAPGQYNFVLLDNQGCPSMSTGVIELFAPQDPPTPTATIAGNTIISDAPTGNQWYNQNGIIPGATGQEFTPTESGEYYVVVIQGGCVSDRSNTVQFFIVSTDAPVVFRGLKIYPNPVTDHLIIEMPQQNNIKVEVLNAVGVTVDQYSMTGQLKIPFANMVPGVYLIRLSDGVNEISKSVIRP